MALSQEKQGLVARAIVLYLFKKNEILPVELRTKLQEIAEGLTITLVDGVTQNDVREFLEPYVRNALRERGPG